MTRSTGGQGEMRGKAWRTGTEDASDGNATADMGVLTAAKASDTTKIVTTTEFRAELRELLELVNRQPVTVASRGARPRGVLVSPDFFDRACDALGEEPYARPPRSRLEEIMAENLQILEYL